MKLVLIQPAEDYVNPRQAYGSITRPPETGLAVLAAWLRAYSLSQPEVEVLNPYTKFEKIVRRASNADFLGMSDWFSNHRTCLDIASAVKQVNSGVKIILGGPNAATLGGLALRNNPALDYVVGSLVTRDGEEGLRGIVDGAPEKEIPNLWYRDKEGVKFTKPEFTALERMPLWDFCQFQDTSERLREYFEAQRRGIDLWQVTPLVLPSFRDCIKAVMEGRCSFCTSSEGSGCRELPPRKFWAQERHLNQLYGAETFFIPDDVFTTSLGRMERLADTKPLETRARIRAYGYLFYLHSLSTHEIKRMAKALEKIGIFNLFYGSENFYPPILAEVNKRGIGVEGTIEVMNQLYEGGGVKATVAFLLGLPGTSKESLRVNLDALRRLLKETGEAFERLYISIAMPLRGSDLFEQLANSKEVGRDYYQETQKVLREDDCPDYRILTRLVLKYLSTVSPQTLARYIDLMIEEANVHIPPHRIGGFMLDI